MTLAGRGSTPDTAVPSSRYALARVKWTRVRVPRILSTIAKLLYVGVAVAWSVPRKGIAVELSVMMQLLVIASFVTSLTETCVDAIRRRAQERGSASAANAGTFARAGRSLEEWQRHLAGGLRGHYRATPISPDDAAAVVASSSATPDRRRRARAEASPASLRIRLALSSFA